MSSLEFPLRWPIVMPWASYNSSIVRPSRRTSSIHWRPWANISIWYGERRRKESTCWDLKCRLNASLRANSLLHPHGRPSARKPAHLNFFEGSCSSMCRFQSCWRVKSFPQWGQTCGRSFLWVNMCVLELASSTEGGIRFIGIASEALTTSRIITDEFLRIFGFSWSIVLDQIQYLLMSHVVISTWYTPSMTTVGCRTTWGGRTFTLNGKVVWMRTGGDTTMETRLSWHHGEAWTSTAVWNCSATTSGR